MSKQTETVNWNRAAIQRMRERQAAAVVTGAECPKCGGGVNPTILAHFGHCLACQRKASGLE
jgi:hypothetical protein